MFNKLKNIQKKQWFKVFALNGFSVGIKFLTGIITSRIVSIYLGASGIALLENIRNLFSFIEAVGVMGIQNAVMQDVISSKYNKIQFQKICTTAFYFVLLWSALLCSILILFFTRLESLFIANSQVIFLLKIIILFYPIIATHLVLQAIINGLELYKKLFTISIITSIISCICNAILIYNFDVLGAIVGIILTPFFLLLGFVLQLNKHIPLSTFFNIKYFDFKRIKGYSSFSKIAVVSGVLLPIVYLSIRNYIVQNLGWEMAGYWSAITRVSSYYFMFVTTLISLYFYPKIAKSTSFKKAQIFILSYLKIILPIFLVLFIFLYFTSFYWIQLLFTKKFLILSNYIFYQFLADFLRIIATIFSYYLLAKKYAYKFIISEFVSLGSFYLATHYLLPLYDLYGVLYAYNISMVCYLFVVFCFYILDSKTINWHLIFNKINK